MFTAAYGVSFGPIGWVLPSEVFPLSMRSRGVALSTASNWFNNCMNSLSIPSLSSLHAPVLHNSFDWPDNARSYQLLSIVSLTSVLGVIFLIARDDRGTFMIFSTACFFAYLWSTYLVPETANVSLEEIDAIFTSSAGREDLEVKHQVRLLLDAAIRVRRN